MALDELAPAAAAVFNNEDAFDSDDDDEWENRLSELAQKTNCNAMRRKIQKFLGEKIMTQTAFLKEIQANSNSYQRFMKLKGLYSGDQNSTYWGALKFFYKYDQEKKKQKKSAKTTAKDTTTTSTTKVTTAQRKQQEAAFLAKVEAVELDDDLPIYDDCDEVRKKINELVGSKILTQTALTLALNVNSNSMRRFLTTKGKEEGCSNGVYVAAYRFFEKLRIAEQKPKTTKRLKTETEKPQGYSTVRVQGYWIDIRKLS